MDVDAGMDVVNEVPAGVVRVIVDGEIIAVAVPAPVRSNIPVPRSDIEVQSARKIEAVVVAVKAFDVITIGRADVIEAAVLIGTSDDEALVIRPVVAVPMIVANVRSAVDAPALITFRFGPRLWLAPGRRRLRDTALIAVHIVVALLLVLLLRASLLALFRTLGKRRNCHKNSQG